MLGFFDFSDFLDYIRIPLFPDVGFPFGILRLWDLGTSGFQDLRILGFQVSWDLRILGFVWFLGFFLGFFGLHLDPPIPRSGVPV